MSTTIERIRNEARALPLSKRAALLTIPDVDLHDDSPAAASEAAIPPVEAAWDSEIARRLREVEEGRVELLSMEQMNARLDGIRAKYAVLRMF